MAAASPTESNTVLAENDNGHEICDIRSHCFEHIMDQDQFRSIYLLIEESSLSQECNIPSCIIQEISEYSTGLVFECDNHKHCKNKVSHLFQHNVIFNDILSKYQDEDGITRQKYPFECVSEIGYYRYGDDFDLYFCDQCILKKGTSEGLKYCEMCGIPMIRDKLQKCDCQEFVLKDYCKQHLRECPIHKVQGCRMCHYIDQCIVCQKEFCRRDSSSQFIADGLIECQKYCGFKVCYDCIIQIQCEECGEKYQTHPNCSGKCRCNARQ